MPRSTPIERAIAGQDQDRRRRYDARQAEAGLVTVRVIVPRDQADRLRSFAAALRDGASHD